MNSLKRPLEDSEKTREKNANKRRKDCNSTIWRLFEQGYTVPFLARYRKELTGNMSAEQLRTSFEEYEVKK